MTADKFQHLLDRYADALRNLEKTAAVKSSAICELCIIRDEIFAMIDASNVLAVGAEEKIDALDCQMRLSAKKYRSALDRHFAQVRELIHPSKKHWWWYPERNNPLWIIAAFFLLTLSLGLLADFSRRLLNSNPDSLGILAIAAQAALTVGASSTFTSTGRKWLRNISGRVRLPLGRQDEIKVGAMILLFAVTFTTWLLLPKRLAKYYNDQTIAMTTEPGSQPALAVDGYSRALSLDPSIYQSHVNLAAVYVENYDFAQATTEYHKALLLQTKDVVAADGLAYVFLLGGDPTTALRILDDTFANLPSPPPTGERLAALYKNLAWAEYQLGFLVEAERDAKRGLAADKPDRAIYCVLAKIYAKQNKPADATAAWKSMSSVAPSTLQQPMIEPDCTRLAQEATDVVH
jgi:tetratricopeptide (TPR) repeat protein